MAKCIYDGISVQNKRNVNMDSLLLKKRTISGQSVCIAVVCDGVGSMEDGAYAASSIVRMLSDWFDDMEDTRRLGLLLRDRVLQINRSITKAARAQGLRTASTLSALLLNGARYYIVHAGDSRIYRYAGGVLTQLTLDQVSGEGKLTSYLGSSEDLKLFYNEGIVSKGIFLLCSDGLYKRLNSNYLLESLMNITPKNMRKNMEQMTRYVMARGERDNITLALVISES